MRSIRFRLILGTASATALVLAASAAALYLLVRVSLLSEFDGALATKARAVASMVEIKASTLKLELDPGQMPEFQLRDRREYFQLWDGEGRTAVRSPSLAADDLPYFQPAQRPVHRVIRLPDGRTGRAVALAFQPQWEDDKQAVPLKGGLPVLIVARNTMELDRALAVVGWLLAFVCGTATVASTLAMVWIVRRGLKPLDVLAGRIAAMDDSSLSQRINLQATPTELSPVTQRLNELLGRLESAFIREKSFTADVAHELRTPLAGLETALEVCSSRRRGPDEYEQVMARCLDAVRRMHVMVDNLLMLARVESHQVKIACESVAIGDLLQECWRASAGRAAERRLQVQFDAGPDCTVHTDREKLRLIFHILFDNAVSYADSGGVMRVKAAISDGRFMLSVSNSGSALSQQEADHAFDRFWRGDAARAETGVHCGLGLTLCKRIVEALGGSMAAQSQVGGEFRVGVALPSRAICDA